MPNEMSVFCFSYAGGSASFFDVIENDLVNCRLVKHEYPGHGTRHREPLCRHFNELADDAFAAWKAAYHGGRYALFGYSMGCITLVEVLRRILADGEMPLPCCVFLAAHEPVSKAGYLDDSMDLSDDWVKERTIRFGNIPEKLRDNNSFWRIYLPLYRADYAMIGEYRFEALALRTTIPAVVFYSETDTPRADMDLWKQFFIGPCEFCCFEGTHFFIQQHHQAIAKIISEHAKTEGDAYDI